MVMLGMSNTIFVKFNKYNFLCKSMMGDKNVNEFAIDIGKRASVWYDRTVRKGE